MLESEEQKGGREDEIEDENKVRREDEIEALQAIYDEAMDVNRGQVPGMDVVLTFHVCHRLTFFMRPTNHTTLLHARLASVNGLNVYADFAFVYRRSCHWAIIRTCACASDSQMAIQQTHDWNARRAATLSPGSNILPFLLWC